MKNGLLLDSKRSEVSGDRGCSEWRPIQPHGKDCGDGLRSAATANGWGPLPPQLAVMSQRFEGGRIVRRCALCESFLRRLRCHRHLPPFLSRALTSIVAKTVVECRETNTPNPGFLSSPHILVVIFQIQKGCVQHFHCLSARQDGLNSCQMSSSVR